MRVLCEICGTVVPEARIGFLLDNGVATQSMRCVSHTNTKKKKGLFLDRVGASRLLVVDDIYDMSIRSVFRAEKDTQNDNDQDD